MANSEKRLREAALLVEKWWVEEGQKHFYGAPAGMFYLRAALAALAAEEPAPTGEYICGICERKAPNLMGVCEKCSNRLHNHLRAAKGESA